MFGNSLVLGLKEMENLPSYLDSMSQAERESVAAIETRMEISEATDLSVLTCLPNLRILCIGQVRDDESCAQIAKIGNLECLRFQSWHTTSRGLEHLKSLTKLRTLYLYGNPPLFGGAEFYSFAAEFSSLNTLHLDYSSSEDGIRYLAALEELHDLGAVCENFSANAMKSISRFCQLKKLGIIVDNTLDPAVLKCFTALQNLEDLYVHFSDTDIEQTSDCLRNISQIPHLKRLRLMGDSCDSLESLRPLAESGSLEDLQLNRYDRLNLMERAALSFEFPILEVSQNVDRRVLYYSENNALFQLQKMDLMSV